MDINDFMWSQLDIKVLIVVVVVVVVFIMYTWCEGKKYDNFSKGGCSKNNIYVVEMITDIHGKNYKVH